MSGRRSKRRVSETPLPKDQPNQTKTPPPFNYDRYKRYKRIAHNAQQQRKIFSIIGAGYHPIRRALLQRGWCERFLEPPKSSLQCLSQHTLLQLARSGNDYETAVVSKLLDPFPSYFVWHPRNIKVTRFDAMRPFKSRLVRDTKFDFTLKEGLVNCDRERRWQHAEGSAELSCPRGYRLCEEGETEAFMRDYRLTGCTSLLAFLVNGIRRDGTNECFAADGVISMKCVDFAVQRVQEMLKLERHEDIDSDCDDSDYDRLDTAQWREFFKDFNEVVRCGAKFQMHEAAADLKRLQTLWIDLVEQCRCVWPHLDTDGFMNVWIMKPARRSRGIGVSVMTDNLRIVEEAQRSKGMRYIVQKYLERPLLIHNTKFDIRQYFLMVTTPSGTSVQVWMYQTSYLKFSSQPFSLHNLHESVHLTNHFVQKNYPNAVDRHPELPACNMWSSSQFQAYLESIGQPAVWQQHIYAGMRRNIVAAVRSAYEECHDLERNCFELVGGDFMVSDCFGVQLLEVNATPDMCASTAVTKEICAACLEDTVKVVVDRCHDVHADTGRFELIDEIAVCWHQESPTSALNVVGTVKQLQQLPEVGTKPHKKLVKRQATVKPATAVQRPTTTTTAVQRPTSTGQHPAPIIHSASIKVPLQVAHAPPKQPTIQSSTIQNKANTLRPQSSVFNETIAHQLQLYNRSIPHRYYMPQSQPVSVQRRQHNLNDILATHRNGLVESLFY